MFRSLAMAAAAVGVLMTAAAPVARAADNPIRKQIFSFNAASAVAPVAGLVRDNGGAFYGVTERGGAQNSGAIYKLAPPAAGQAAWTQTILYTFPAAASGLAPQPPIADTNGALYGALYFGGAARKGLVYRFGPPASGLGPSTFSVLYTFAGGADGEGPWGRLTFDTSGALYGVTRYGGAKQAGVVYRLKPNAARTTWTYERLWDLETPDGTGGSALASRPIFDAAGRLNLATGATRTGSGAVIRLAPPASGETLWTRQTVYRFAGGVDGAQPGPVALGLDGAIFGMTTNGGANGFGQAYRIAPPPTGQSVWSKTVLHEFQGGGDGGRPTGELLLDTSGAVYGSTSRLASNGTGIVFRLSPPAGGADVWTRATLATFRGGDADGLDSLTFDASGGLVLAARNGGAGSGAIYSIMIPPYGVTNKTMTSLYSFPGGLAGAVPDQAPIFGPDGALYGTTQQGGGDECGMAYKLAPPAAGQSAWTKTDLVYFDRRPWPCIPAGSLTFGDRGVLYGFSAQGGAYAQGTVFKLTPYSGGWDRSVLFKFSSGATGAWPVGRPLLDSSGAIYGTASGGAYGKGLLFKLTPGSTWTQTIVHNFGAAGDGAYPIGDLVFDGYGAIFGLTTGGGASDKGTVYRLAPPPSGSGAWTQEILFSFSGLDGADPRGRLALDTEGSLFGTTRTGGAYNQGTVYRLAPPAAGQTRWGQTVLYNFRGNLDGANPEAGVIIGAQRALSGTTSLGGGSACGTAFRLLPPDAAHAQWRRLVLHNFACGPDGKYPNPGLVASTHGELYGVTLFGGASDKGEIFRLD